jgi:hypothetical protein
MWGTLFSTRLLDIHEYARLTDKTILKYDNMGQICLFTLHIFTESQQRYTTFNKELLAIIVLLMLKPNQTIRLTNYFDLSAIGSEKRQKR